MIADPAFVTSLALLGVAIIVVLVLYRPRDRSEEWRTALLRLSERIEDASKAQQEHGYRLSQVLLDHERARQAEHSVLARELERRLAETAAQQAHAAGELRNVLTERFGALKEEVSGQLGDGRTHLVRSIAELREQTSVHLVQHQTRFEQRQSEALKLLSDTLRKGMETTQRQVSEALMRGSEEMGKRVDALTQSTDERLKSISAQVDKRLNEGFEKTTATFTDVLKRLALIDEAQKRITELSTNVVSLQEVLSDKRSRGAFGEVQLKSLVDNMMPAQSYAMQHTLSNGRRADCVLFLPEPTGTIAIDSKFPLESYQAMTDLSASELERRKALTQFRYDVTQHIKHISERYIVPGETSDGAIMFVPAEAVFAEIQAHHPDVVQQGQRSRVWMASPTTLMAILNTARAVLKDEATRKQIHVIRRHLSELAKDFDRFRERMDKLATHIGQAQRDVAQVNVSARKISDRFDTIEKVEMEGEPIAEVDGPTEQPDDATGSR